MQEHFKTFAHYNQWANDKLFSACGKLPLVELHKERKAFFNSIQGTLNHLLVGDRLWLGRFKGIDSGITALDQILYADFDTLLQARQKEDQNIIEYIDRLKKKQITDNFTFTSLAGKEYSVPLKWLLSHLFNHQTHHRGQVHNMLSQTAMSPPSMDLYYFMLEGSYKVS